MRVGAANSELVCFGVVLGEIVGEVGAATFPENDELALGNSILEPVELHVDCFGADLFDTFVGDAVGGGVGIGDGRGRLWMAHIDEVCAEYGDVLGVMEQGANFGFSSMGHDFLEDGVDGVY